MKAIFNKLNISEKLASVFMLLLFMMGIGGFVGLYNAKQLARATEQLYKDSFKRNETLTSVENEFLSARQDRFLQAIISDEVSKSYLHTTIEEHKDKINKLLAEYRDMGTGKNEHIFRELLVNLNAYWEIHDEVEALSAAGNKAKAMSLIRMEGNKAFTDALSSLRKLIKIEKDRAYDAYIESEYFAKVIIAVTVAFTLIALIFVIFLWRALTRSIIRPIIMIEESAKKIAMGEMSERVPVMTDDELGNLAMEFNKMAEGIEFYYTTLERKVAERTEELRLANDELILKKQESDKINFELEEANRMKSQFLANVSHELRTPLNSIIGFSELLQEKAFGDLNARQSQYVEFVHSSGQHLLQLINNILDLSKIEAGRMDLHVEEFPIMEVLGETLGIVRPLAHKKNVSIRSKTVPASPMILADKAKFKQIMLNILSNAIKFNKEGGSVIVDWEVVDEPVGMSYERQIVFRITDTGIGIKNEDKHKLFTEFEQIDSSITREYGGTGLGLVLTKRLVELHEGSIWFESEAERGSTFFIKLKVGTDALDVPDLSKSVYANPSLSASELILVAGESPDVVHLVEIYLAGGSYEVIGVADGVDLLVKARELKPFAIISGVTMPRMDGWEVLRELKSNEGTSAIPVIIITSVDNKSMGLKLGAEEYLEKPVNRDRLLGALDRIRSSRAAKIQGSDGFFG